MLSCILIFISLNQKLVVQTQHIQIYSGNLYFCIPWLKGWSKGDSNHDYLVIVWPLYVQGSQTYPVLLFVFNFFFFKFIFERETVWLGEGQREGDTESEAGSRLRAISTEPDLGLKLTNHEIMTWTEVRHLANWATQVPLPCLVWPP